MSQERSIRNTLIDAEDCCIVVIDVQSVFLDKLTEEDRRGLVPRIVWFANVATRLGITSVVTAEDIEKNGSIIPELAAVLPASTTVHNKMVFGLAADPKIYDAIESTGKRVAVLVGLETDVCVAQSAIGLLKKNLEVVAISNACGSPGRAHRYGLRRMEDAGVVLSDVKSLFYEWIRTIPDCRTFFSEHKDELGDPGIAL